MKSEGNPIVTLAKSALHEGVEFALLTTYFYVAFAILILFKATVLQAYGVHYVVWGAAIVKAILIAKFMLLGRAVKISNTSLHGPLIKPILIRSFGFLILLLLLTGAQEVATGLLHRQTISSLFHEFTGSKLGETLAEVLILQLVLVPLVAFNVLGEALGEGSLTKMLFSNRVGRKNL
jgi:hypothetical protein